MAAVNFILCVKIPRRKQILSLNPLPLNSKSTQGLNMKNFILSAFVAFAVSGCALFTSNDAPAMAGNINAVKSEVLS